MKKIWITYCWADHEEGDFDYLVTILRNVGVQATYDKIPQFRVKDFGNRLLKEFAIVN